MTPAARRYAKAMTAWCRYCGSWPGFRCRSFDGATASRPHQARLDEAARVRRAASPLPGGRDGGRG